MRGGDALTIVEAAYADTKDDAAWVRGVVEAAAAVIGREQGAGGCTFEADGSSVAFQNTCTTSSTAEAVFGNAASMTSIAGQIPGLVERAYPSYPFADTFVRVSGLGPRWMESAMVRTWLQGQPKMRQVRDLLGLVGGNPGRRGVLVLATAPAAIRATPDNRAMWIRVAAHIAAGYRLRLAGLIEPDAVLDPGGRTVHAESGLMRAAREELSLGVRAIDRARSKLRRVDPRRALAIWRGLVAGRWSLVDQFDHDGRRYVLAKRNAPGVRAWRKLTQRETQVLDYAAHGQPHKVIAYELGISMATVGADLASAASKVGLRSRLDLVAAYRASPRSALQPTAVSTRGGSG